MPDVSPERDLQFRQMRETARKIFAAALANASIESAFARNLHCERRVLRIGDDLHDLDSYHRVFVVSIGKAAHTMAAALEAQVGSGASKQASSLPPSNPKIKSAASAIFAADIPRPPPNPSAPPTPSLSRSPLSTPLHSPFLCSPAAARPSWKSPTKRREISLPDLAATYRALVHSGAPIAEINAIRKHLSAVKGGRLAQAAYPAQQVSILVSDVPSGTPDALASGPTMPDSTSIYDCERIAAKYNLVDQFPDSVADLFRHHALDETPKSDDPAFVRARWWTVLSNAVAVDAAAAAATGAGFAVEIDNSCDDWPYEKAAAYLVNRVRELRRKVSRVCLISGGEVTVNVRNGGIGGRNQQFALACAELISGDDITVLSAGTDGIDGNSPAAGAVADGSTVLRAAKLEGSPTACPELVEGSRGFRDVGSIPRHALSAFNAYPLFDPLGDAIVTGPTGNNLRDLRILLAY